MNHPARAIGLSVIESEAKAVQGALLAIDSAFEKAVDILLSCQGKVVLTGMGKSGLVARKISSTLSSTGTPSVFLHPAEAAHGDLGLLSPQDILIAFSQSGQSQELNGVLNFSVRIGIPIISFTGNRTSLLAQCAEAVIDTSVEQEGCPLGLAPTASSTKALALGDALAVSVSQLKGFTSENFHYLHPGGGLGQRFLKVKDLMHSGDSLPLLTEDTDMKTVLLKMSSGDVRGACGVLSPQGDLIGIITDGDIRRKIHQDYFFQSVTAAHIMTKHPRTIDENELAQKALFLMEEFRVNVLFVTQNSLEQGPRPVGVLHIQDLLKAKIK
jgi:arabinose-5-phosphate isomerase